ncbi:MAG: undecaprenyldiphospho-muramoylpentapeptide beta-N-acetylglucosaminyltransferase [Firmicutes bacterium]|nr:undecaprenyldiphospho-muramoylpentapeptide beta-N-acetylglucosaminyltransferase [Bacillota bacterium]
MRVIMTGGGTGGHIYPAIAIADKIMERTEGSEILFVGTSHGLEKDLVPHAGYEIKFVTASGINRKNLFKNIKVFADYNKGKKEARKIVEDFKPDIVIGTGGYASGPIVRVAASMGIACYVQEQNAFPGVTNKMLERYVEKVFLGFEEAGKYFKHPEKHVVSGNPVRADFCNFDRAKAREALGLKEDDIMLLSFGGSQGAGRINKAMIDVVKKFSGEENLKVIFPTGKAYYEPIVTELNDLGIDTHSNINIMEYISDMQDYLSAADLVIARSGALTISEIAICGRPSILIPSPNVTGDHQTFNAKAIADKGGALLLPEAELSGERLVSEIEGLISDKDKLDEMSKCALGCGQSDSADIIYYSIIT